MATAKERAQAIDNSISSSISSIKTALTNKGVSVPSTVKLKDVSGLINNIVAGSTNKAAIIAEAQGTVNFNSQHGELRQYTSNAFTSYTVINDANSRGVATSKYMVFTNVDTGYYYKVAWGDKTTVANVNVTEPKVYNIVCTNSSYFEDPTDPNQPGINSAKDKEVQTLEISEELDVEKKEQE